ncbi:cysteine desulfurase family protein [Marinomonas sp. 15G1-11]|uniref:cysteine desulfurase n=1 Tax=Marinomonas phaeophyticola TaxID=3004091 RepID=A0ABT4JZD6_9GAMM|nr:cysteine desulfurase family protein [Marinomonas sp. 15G1-11]MCZ2723596.1 cysteine desulfurase family protein [Marinomonas sp. 15G1-11]
MIYLDSAASYPLLPEVKISLMKAFEECYANSASSHLLGTKALLETNMIREQLADMIGAYPSEIVFTSGATESNNIAFKSLLLSTSSKKKHVVISAMEHKCIFAICDFLKDQGFSISIVMPNKHGVIDASSVSDVLTEDTVLVSIMHVNNELGTVNPIAEIGKLCFKKGILFHSDAAQSFGKTSIHVDDMNVDLMSFSGHKIGGPKGIGAIYIRDLRKRDLVPVIHGAGQEQGVRGGTVATPLIIGFGVAMSTFHKSYQSFEKKMIRDYLVEQLSNAGVEFIINGSNTLAHIISLSLPKTNIGVLVRDNEQAFCLAQGSACSSKEIEASHVLMALGLSREEAEHTFRISFTNDIQKTDIDSLVASIKKAKK